MYTYETQLTKRLAFQLIQFWNADNLAYMSEGVDNLACMSEQNFLRKQTTWAMLPTSQTLFFYSDEMTAQTFFGSVCMSACQNETQ